MWESTDRAKRGAGWSAKRSPRISRRVISNRPPVHDIGRFDGNLAEHVRHGKEVVVTTVERSYCNIGEWDSMEVIVVAAAFTFTAQ